MILYLYIHTLIPIELLPYLQCVAITETKGSLDELVTFNYMYTIYFKYNMGAGIISTGLLC
jgi:hypothetical protein